MVTKQRLTIFSSGCVARRKTSARALAGTWLSSFPPNGPRFVIRCPPDPVRLITHSQTNEFSEFPVVHGWRKVSSPSSIPALLSTILSLIKTYPPSMSEWQTYSSPVISLHASLKLWLGPHYAQTLPTAFMAQLPTQIFSRYLYTFPTLWPPPNICTYSLMMGRY